MKKLQNAKHNGSTCTAYFSRKYLDKLFIDGNYVPRNLFFTVFPYFFQYSCGQYGNFCCGNFHCIL